MTKELKVIDPVGIHVRPATIITKEASKYKSTMEIIYNGKSGNLKSIISVMSLGIPNTASITLKVEGPDAEAAFNNLLALLVKEKIVQ